MTQYLVTYTKIPTFHNPPKTATVEAADPETARKLVRHRLNDFAKVSLYVIEAAREIQADGLKGSILTMG